MQTGKNDKNLKNARLTKEDLIEIGGYENLSEDEIENFLKDIFIYANLIIELYEE